jgi:hypothetical protein
MRRVVASRCRRSNSSGHAAVADDRQITQFTKSPHLRRDAIDQHHADEGQYPGTLDELVSSGYLRKVPDDPFTLSASTWQTVASEPDPNNPNAPPGVYDVKSGSDATALDGTKYSDW